MQAARNYTNVQFYCTATNSLPFRIGRINRKNDAQREHRTVSAAGMHSATTQPPSGRDECMSYGWVGANIIDSCLALPGSWLPGMGCSPVVLARASDRYETVQMRKLVNCRKLS